MSHTIASIRFENHVLEQVDQHAEQQGMSRTQYVLSWLPENQDNPPQTTTKNTPNTANSTTR